MSVAREWIKRHSIQSYIILAYGITWVMALPMILVYNHIISVDVSFGLHYLLPYGPLLSAVIVSWAAGGVSNLRNILSRMSRWRVKWVWLVVAILSVWLLYAASGAIEVLTGAQWPGLELFGQVQFLPYLTFAGAWLLWVATFGIGEETGWRGYLLPSLQSRYSALTSAMMVSVIWAGWHIPMFFYNENLISLGAVGTVFWLIGLMFGSTLLTWLYNSSKGSILMTALWHGTFNLFTGATAQAASMTSGIITMFVMVWVVLIVVIYRPSDLSKSERQMQTGTRCVQ